MVSGEYPFSMRNSSGSHWWWKRGQLTASCTFMFQSIMLIATSSTVLIIVGPPGDPSTANGLPSRIRIVGTIEESGVLPGWMALNSPWISPYMLASPGFGAKSDRKSVVEGKRGDLGGR